MRHLYTIIAALMVCLMLSPSKTQAQCKQFSELEVMPLLGDYIISGRYNTLKLREGEEILIFKTLSKGIDYRWYCGHWHTDRVAPDNLRFVFNDFIAL